MKKLLVILFAFGLTLGANAQPKIGGGFRGGSVRGGGVHGGGYVRPRVTVIAPAYPYYGSGFRYGSGLSFGLGYGYPRFYDPFYGRHYAEKRPAELDLAIEDIKNDYDYQISTAKHDKSLTKDERKQKVRDLKHQKDDEIITAKKNYYSAKDGQKDS